MSELKASPFASSSSFCIDLVRRVGVHEGRMNSTEGEATTGVGGRPTFTATQWQELEHQAMIYKYLTAGLPVPPELLIAVQRSFEALPGRYFHHPALSYCSYYGKKLDPEPGRCRRTDGKKWRCSKDSHPDSKYCTHHMHRGRNRSRKPVESQSVAQLQLSSSTGTSSAPTAGPSIPQHSITGHNSTPSLFLGASSSLQLHMDPGPLESRYFSGAKPGVHEHIFRNETSGSARSLEIYGIDNLWHLTTPRVSSCPLPKASTPYSVQAAYPQHPPVKDLSQATLGSASRQQHSFVRSEVDAPETTKHEAQFLLPFFDEWPKTRESWCDLEEERSKQASVSATQLSMAFPIVASDLSTSSSKSSKSESASSRTDLHDMI